VTPLNETAPHGQSELCTLSSALPLVVGYFYDLVFLENEITIAIITTMPPPPPTTTTTVTTTRGPIGCEGSSLGRRGLTVH